MFNILSMCIIYICMYSYVCVRGVCMCECVCVYVRACMCACDVCVYVCVCVHVYGYVHVHVYMSLYCMFIIGFHYIFNISYIVVKGMQRNCGPIGNFTTCCIPLRIYRALVDVLFFVIMIAM